MDPVFGPFFFGRLLALVGNWAFNIAAAIVAWDISRSTLVVSAVSIALFAPLLLLAPLSGAQADRGNVQRQIFVGRLLVFLAACGLAGIMLAGGTDSLPHPWILITMSGVVGLGFVIGGPAQETLLPTMVRGSELSKAVALNVLAPAAARAVGPLLGMALIVSAGPAVAFLFAGTSSLVFAILVLILPLANRLERATPGLDSVRAGLSYLRGDRVVLSLLLGMLALGLGVDPVITLSPALAAEFGGGETLVGAFVTIFGVGAALGYGVLAAARGRWGMHRITVVGHSSLATAMLLAGLSPVAAGSMAAFGLAGIGFCLSITGLTTLVYEQTPEVFRGRVMAVWAMAFVGSRPAGAALSGVIADGVSVAAAFAVVAILVGLIGFVGITQSSRHLAVRDPNIRHLSEQP